MTRGKDEVLVVTDGHVVHEFKELGLDATGTEYLINQEWSALIRHLMESQGIEDRYRKVMVPAVRAMARAMANVEINTRQKELTRERSAMLEAYSGFVKVAKDLIVSLDLGPYDEVVSVAVRRSDGRIEVVEIKR